MLVYKVFGGLGHLFMGYLIMCGYVLFTKKEAWLPR